VPRDESLAMLAERFLRSHGPATIRDFVWWSGLQTADAKRGLEMVRARSEQFEGHTYWTIGAGKRAAPRTDAAHLLPIYDEYLVAYRDRAAVPHGPIRSAWEQGTSVTFQNPVVIDGHVAGTWRIARRPDEIRVTILPTRRLTRLDREALDAAVSRFGGFAGEPVKWSIAAR
jgi:hypothetical protein